MPDSFRAVIFDMDGLMIDTEHVFRMIWQKSAEDIGHVISDELFLSFIGSRDVDCEARLKELWGDFPLETFRSRLKARWLDYAANNMIPHKPGLAEILDYVDAQGLKKAVATSSVLESARRKLGPLLERFDAIVTGGDVRQGKPAPDIFILAAEKLGVSTSECLVLEDSHAGMQAARAAGIYAIMVPDMLSATEDIPHVCQSLHDVLAWLKSRQ